MVVVHRVGNRLRGSVKMGAGVGRNAMSEDHSTDDLSKTSEQTDSINRRNFVKSLGVASGAAIFGATSLASPAAADKVGENTKLDASDIDRTELTGESREKYIDIALEDPRVSEIQYKFEKREGYDFSYPESDAFRWSYSEDSGKKKTDYYTVLSFDHPDSEIEDIFVLWTTSDDTDPVGYVFYEELEGLNELPAVKHDVHTYSSGSLNKEQYQHRDNATVDQVPASTISTENVTPQMVCTPIIKCTGNINYKTLVGTILVAGASAGKTCSPCVATGLSACGPCIALLFGSGLLASNSCNNGRWKNCGCYCSKCRNCP